MSFEDALRNETVLGRETIESGEHAKEQPDSQGAGRHGDFSDI